MPYINTPGGGIGSSQWYSDPSSVTIDNRPLWQQSGYMIGPASTGYATVESPHPWMPGAGMPSVSSDGTQLGPNGWQRMGQIQQAMPRQQAAPYDSVFTGHATERMPEDPRVMGLASQYSRQFGAGNGDPSYGQYSIPGEGNFLRINGQEQQIPAGADDSWIQGQIAAKRTAPMTTADRASSLMKALQGRRDLDGLQQSQIFTRVMGVDPQSFAKSQGEAEDHHMKAAVELQNQRKALLEEYNILAKSGGGLPEDILASYGKNMAAGNHQNEYYNPGRELPPDQMGEERSVPGGWRGFDPGTVARMRQIRQTLGIDTQAQKDIPALQAEHAALLAERAAHMAGVGVDAIAPFANAHAPAPLLPAGVRAHNYLANQATGDAKSAWTSTVWPWARKGINAEIGYANAPADLADFISQFATGDTNARSPFRIPYIPR